MAAAATAPLVAYQTLQHARLAAPAARPGGGPNALLVGAPEQQSP